jgi:hypothetical protein
MDLTNGCPPGGAPVELADGKIVMPDDTLTLAEICEIVPLIIESMAKAGANGKLSPGQAVQVAKSPFGPFGTPALPTQRPGALPGSGGAIAPNGGAPGGWGGGGGRGSRGPTGPRGLQGPPGVGGIAAALKTDGNFIVASVSPFVPVPGTGVAFTPSEAGYTIFLVQAVFGGDSVSDLANGQLGLRVDGVDYPLTANLVHATVAGVDQFLAGVHASFPILLSAAPHLAEIIVRGDSSLGAPTGSPLTVQANATIPLALTVMHR